MTTLSDVRAFMVGLPEERQGQINWQIAAARLIEAAEDPTPARVETASEAFEVALTVTMVWWRD